MPEYQGALSQAQIDALLHPTGNGPGSAYGLMDQGGLTYGSTGIESTDEGGHTYDPTGFTAADTATYNKPGAEYMGYGLDGTQSGIGHNRMDANSWAGIMAPLAVFTLGASGLLGAGMSAAEGVAGSGAGFVGEGAASGIPAWDAAAGSGIGTEAGAGTFLGEGIPSGVPEWDAAASNAGLDMSTTGYQPWEEGFQGSDVLTNPNPAATGSKPFSFGNPFGNMSLSTAANVVKAVGALASAGKGEGSGSSGSSGGPSGPSTPFDYGPAQYMPPGWRTDRPMYVPGRDAVPDGWRGPGGGFQG